MCWQAISRLCMSIRESLSNSIDLAGINEYAKGVLMQISKGLGTFAMVLFEGSSETELLSVYLSTFFNSVTLKIQSLPGSLSSPKYLKFHVDFKYASKNCEKFFSFSDKYIWISIVKLSLLRTGYPSSAANVLTSSPKNLHVNNRDFSNTIDFAVINEYNNDAVMQISTVLGDVCHVACGNLLRNGTF